MQGFNFRGGVTLAPEFIALFLGLSLYIAAFIAEIVRSGIQSVSRGQIEAARSVGLGPGDLNRYVVLPQALRVIIPPAASQYVSLFKNSSLGVAIGYPELFNISNTVTTVSGQAIECVLIMAGVYLLISLVIAVLMNVCNSGQIRNVESDRGAHSPIDGNPDDLAAAAAAVARARSGPLVAHQSVQRPTQHHSDFAVPWSDRHGRSVHRAVGIDRCGMDERGWR